PLLVVRHLRLIRQPLLALARTGNTLIGKAGRTSDDRLSVQVFPANGIDALLFRGVHVDVHLQHGVTEQQLDATRETSVGSADALEFLEQAVAFAHERLWGTLNATLIAHPATFKDASLATAVQRAISRLRYGA